MIVYIGHHHIEFGNATDQGCVIDESLEFDELGDVIPTVEKRLERPHGPVTVLLSGCHGFAQTLELEQKIGTQKNAVAFGVESFLPLAAEELDADFVRKSDLVVATQGRNLLNWLESLAQQGKIHAVGFRPLLFVQKLQQENRIPADCRLLVVIDDEFDLVTIRSGKIRQWKWMADRNALEFELACSAADIPLTGWGHSNHTLDDLESEFDGGQLKTADVNFEAWQVSEQVRKGKSWPLVSVPEPEGLKAGDLENVFAMIVAGLAVLFLGVAAFFYARTLQLNEQSRLVGEDIVGIHERILPGVKPGPLIVRSLEARLTAWQTLQKGVQETGVHPQVLPELKRILTTLPQAAGKYSVDRIEIAPAGIELSGVCFDETAFSSFSQEMDRLGFQAINRRRDTPTASGHRAFAFRIGLQPGESTP